MSISITAHCSIIYEGARRTIVERHLYLNILNMLPLSCHMESLHLSARHVNSHMFSERELRMDAQDT